FRLGYSKKGYTTGEIGIEWIRHFDLQTKEKAAGHRRLLLVDGHVLNCMKGFLDYMHANHINVVCYPPHSTHIYQGLNIVIFSVLKRCWTEAHDRFEHETGQKVSKLNFLSIYGRAHVKALTADNIHTAF
ncbi:CENP-B protein, partial [Wolfiporia cocos MD-104 SS10]